MLPEFPACGADFLALLITDEQPDREVAQAGFLAHVRLKAEVLLS